MSWNSLSNNITDLERVATAKRNLNDQKLPILLQEYVVEPGQACWHLKTIIE